MLIQYFKRLIAVAAVVVLLFSLSAIALGQPGGATLDGQVPPLGLDGGRVDVGGDGVSSLAWIRNCAARIVAADEDASVPSLHWTKAMHAYNASNNVAYDPEGFCLPPGGPRSMGTPYPIEIIQHRDRIIIIFEGGGHVWREIHMDGRQHPDKETLNPSYFGHSVGHWEGDTLVVDTVGFNEKTWLDFGGHMHSDQLHTIEYITRPDKNTLHYEATIDDPGAYTEAWTVAWDINWSEGQELADYICQENNKYMIDLTDDFGNPFFETTAVAR